MKIQALLFAAIVLLPSVGCKKESAYKTCAADRYFPRADSLYRQSERHGWSRQSLRDALAGEWRLVKSESGGCGIAGVDYERCDNVRLKIPVSGPYEAFLNDTLSAKKDFEIDSAGHNSFPAIFYIRFENFTPFLNGKIVMRGDYMICGTASGDGTDYYYKRESGPESLR